MPERTAAETIDSVMGSQFAYFGHPFAALKKAKPISSGDANRFLALKFLPAPKMLANDNYSAKLAYYKHSSGMKLSAVEKTGKQLPESIVLRHCLNPINWPYLILNSPAASLNFMKQKILLSIDKKDLAAQEVQREEKTRKHAEALVKRGIYPSGLVNSKGSVSNSSPAAYRRKVMVTIAFYPFEMLAAIPQFIGALVTGLPHGALALGSYVYHWAKGDLKKNDFRWSEHAISSARSREGYEKVSRDSQNENEVELTGEVSKSNSSEPEREPSQPSQTSAEPSKVDPKVETLGLTAAETEPLLAGSTASDNMQEKVPKQPQHLGSIAMVLEKLEPEVVRGEVPAPAFDEAFEEVDGSSVPKPEVPKVTEDRDGEGESEAREDGNRDGETAHF